jgi:hypothetical protein
MSVDSEEQIRVELVSLFYVFRRILPRRRRQSHREVLHAGDLISRVDGMRSTQRRIPVQSWLEYVHPGHATFVSTARSSRSDLLLVDLKSFTEFEFGRPEENDAITLALMLCLGTVLASERPRLLRS